MSLYLLAFSCSTAPLDSPPVQAGWFLETQARGHGTAVPGQRLRVPVTLSLSGIPDCGGCLFEQQAELQLSVTVPAGSGQELQLSLLSSDSQVIVARQLFANEQSQRVLLTAPLFEQCAPSGCLQTLYFVADSPQPVALQWRIQAQSVSTHDQEDWVLDGVELSVLDI